MRSTVNIVLPFFIITLFVACTPTGTSGRWWTEDERMYILNELERTSGEVRNEIETLSEEQWNFRESEERWSIGEIIEHLEMQNQLHYREITISSNSPQVLEYRGITRDRDSYFIKYATDTIKGQANWFLIPLGKFCTKDEGEYAFFMARNNLKKFVETTPADLRKQFTFRAPAYDIPIGEMKIGQVRDLHQLLLTGIAHTDRHLNQIKNIKKHPEYPRN